jgi:hypothetical protein
MLNARTPLFVTLLQPQRSRDLSVVRLLTAATVGGRSILNRRAGVGGAGGAGARREGALLGGARRAAATGARGAAASDDGARFREIQPEYQCVNGDTPNPLIWGSGTPFTAE